MDAEVTIAHGTFDAVTLWAEQGMHWLVQFVEHFGVGGIFIMTFLESTFVPIPSEITMIPAGYLVQQGKLHLLSVLAASVMGTVSGAYFNYLIARHLGRGLFLRYGRYFLMTPEKLAKLESFFFKHGAISTFTGRLIPGVRHYISFPAGLAAMPVRKFVFYTACGGVVWMSVLLALGGYIGKNQALAAAYLPWIKLGITVFVITLSLAYAYHARRKVKQATPTPDDRS